MYSVSETGGLAVIWETRESADIDRQLKQIDQRLFLDPEHDGQRVFWTVKFWNGERANPPVSLILDWRKPLTDQLVQEVKRQYQRGPLDLEAIRKANLELQARKAEEAQETYEELTRDFERHDKRSHVVHRSQGLRMSRDRQRARGRKV